MKSIEFRPSIRRDFHKLLGITLLGVMIHLLPGGLISKQVHNPKSAHKVWAWEKSIGQKMQKLPLDGNSVYLALGLIGLIVIIKTVSTNIKLDPATIRIDEGILIRRMESISFTAVKDHEITTNLWEMFLGICTLHVISNDPSCPKLKLRGLPRGLANEMYDFMRLNAANSIVELVKIQEAKNHKKGD